MDLWFLYRDISICIYTYGVLQESWFLKEGFEVEIFLFLAAEKHCFLVAELEVFGRKREVSTCFVLCFMLISGVISSNYRTQDRFS